MMRPVAFIAVIAIKVILVPHARAQLRSKDKSVIKSMTKAQFQLQPPNLFVERVAVGFPPVHE